MISESSPLISGGQFATTLGIGVSATAIFLEEGYRLDNSTTQSVGYVVGIATILVTASYIAQRYLSRRI